MNINLTQAELCKAVEFYLNGSVLKDKVEVTSIKRETGSTNSGNSVLHVMVETRPEQEEVKLT